MARKYLTGDVEIERTLRRLGDKAGDRIAKSALGAALNVFRKAMRKEAPFVTGETRRSVGRRLERRRRTGMVTAKVGIDVGKVRKGKERKKSAYAWIVALRTHFIPAGYSAARGAATTAMREKASQRLIKELKKAKG